ncbi:MAG TPA: AAA family ATPase [Aestuariivirga sp.]|nr:AAA family ATPase [Alphaproteobacteria bacterium]HRX35949.1 AAA family ATPase [Aestuariivirga sp.]
MYAAYFRLKEKPFSMLPNPEFIYWSDMHAKAYTMLEYGILNNAGFTVITGEIGCGKTTLVHHLLSQIGKEVNTGLLADSQVNTDELIRWILMAFNQDFEQKTEAAAFRDFRDYVQKEYANGRRTVLIVDEAQNLSVATLEKLRTLSNINVGKDNMLQIVMTGQPQLRTLLKRPELAQFVQRIGSEFHMTPLSQEEVRNYIVHRVHAAGCPVSLFSSKACNRIAAASGGIPRVINLLCDTALVYGFARGSKYISEEIAEAVIADRKAQGMLASEAEETRPAPENDGRDLLLIGSQGK